MSRNNKHRVGYYDDGEDTISRWDHLRAKPFYWFSVIFVVVVLIVLSVTSGPRVVQRYFPETYDLLGGNGDRNYDVRGMTPGNMPKVDLQEQKQVQSKQQTPIEKMANP